jgi:hypothetical protein
MSIVTDFEGYINEIPVSQKQFSSSIPIFKDSLIHKIPVSQKKFFIHS